MKHVSGCECCASVQHGDAPFVRDTARRWLLGEQHGRAAQLLEPRLKVNDLPLQLLAWGRDGRRVGEGGSRRRPKAHVAARQHRSGHKVKKPADNHVFARAGRNRRRVADAEPLNGNVAAGRHEAADVST